jgi:tetratricopeptide (TPR) repeat protein
MKRLLRRTPLLLLLVASWLTAQTVPELIASGQTMLIRGDYLGAIDAFRQAVEINPNDVNALTGLADAYFTIDEYDQAQNQIERALRLTRQDSAVQVLAARIAIGRGDLERADALFGQVLEREPNNVDAAIGRAELALAQGRSSAARAALEQSLRVRPEYRRALLSLALVYEYQGDIDAARRYMSLAERVHRDRADVHIVAAQFYDRIGDLESAGRAARTARAIDPLNLEAARVLASIALEEQNLGTATSLAEELITADRSDDAAWFMRAMSQARNDEQDAALTSIRTAMRLAPDEELYRVWAEELARETLGITNPLRVELASARADEAARLAREYRWQAALRRYRRALLLAPLEAPIREAYAEVLRSQSFVASYLQELAVAHEGESSTSGNLDVLEASISADPAAQWGVNQFTTERSRVPVAVYATGTMTARSAEANRLILRLVASGLRSSDAVAVLEDAVLADGAAAFSAARSQNVDFFILLDSVIEDGAAAITARLAVTRTGVEVGATRSVRSGPEYLSQVADALVSDLVAALPERASVIERVGDRVLIDRGERDGLEIGAAFTILPAGSVITAPERAEYVYRDEEIRGTATVTRLDDLIAEADVEIAGLIDRLRIADVLLPVVSEEDQADATDVRNQLEQSDLGLLLYDRIRRLR